MRRLARVFLAAGVVIGTGTVGFRVILDESWLNAFYRTVVTATLNGLDSPPHGTAGRLWTVVLVLAGVTIFAYVGAVVVEAIAGGVLTGAWAEKRRRKTIEQQHDHFIICGYGRVGQRIASEFRQSGAPYVVIDFTSEALEAARESDELLVEGNATDDDDLERAGIARARGLVAASDSDSDNLYITLSARAANPNLLIVARASDEDAEKKLRLAGADRVVLPYATAGRVMANLTLKPQVAAFLNVVTTADGPDLRFEEIEITASCVQADKSIGELHVRARTGASIIAVRHRGGEFDTRPSAETTLHVGDVVVGVGTDAEIRALEDLFAPSQAVGR